MKTKFNRVADVEFRVGDQTLRISGVPFVWDATSVYTKDEQAVFAVRHYAGDALDLETVRMPVIAIVTSPAKGE
jgi:hypothetical protein